MITQMKNAIAMAALTALAALSSCTKSGEPVTPTFTGDFTNLTSELVESTIGVDSALVIDKIVKDGFAYKEDRTTKYYINNSYGLDYNFYFENGKVIQVIGTLSQEISGKDVWTLFKQENEKLMARKLAFFRGEAYHFNEQGGFEKFCTKSQMEMKEKIDNRAFNDYNGTFYSNGQITTFANGIYRDNMQLGAEGKNTTLEGSDTFFSMASSDCEE